MTDPLTDHEVEQLQALQGEFANRRASVMDTTDFSLRTIARIENLEWAIARLIEIRLGGP